ncbi:MULTISPECIES: NADPH-dependent oxidoreductase [Vagococcus]|uniref:NADPH-dependent oxidoreductase n=1 Tax=Vagococcus TaxID=2737 RepID=UPI000E51A406|nr:MULTISPECIES: NADPH-dependent oxidoreductase [Vagococcus]RHH71008.1 NADPH-dependent oxidoreductase [Vagococcus sp. AM17-17]
MNDVIKLQLNHKSIRKFKDEQLPKEVIETLVNVARHTATCNFMQSYSIVCLSSQEKKQKLAEICNQPYVAEASHVFIFVADQYRNRQIAVENSQETSVLHNMDRFMVAMTDAVLAAQNVNLAAESLGLGTVFLGSILNDNNKTSELLELPELTFAVLGLAIGYKDQEPQLKPRLPQDIMFFEESYQTFDNYVEALKDYDDVVTTYYDLRDANKRIESFTNQITASMNRKPEKRLKIKSDLEKQGFIID